MFRQRGIGNDELPASPFAILTLNSDPKRSSGHLKTQDQEKDVQRVSVPPNGTLCNKTRDFASFLLILVLFSFQDFSMPRIFTMGNACPTKKPTGSGHGVSVILFLFKLLKIAVTQDVGRVTQLAASERPICVLDRWNRITLPHILKKFTRPQKTYPQCSIKNASATQL